MRAPASRLVPLVLLVLFATPIPPALPWHDDDTPILHSATVDHPGWVSYVFDTDGAKVVVDIEAFEIRRPLQLAAVIYRENEQGIFAFTLTALPGHNGVYLDANPTPDHNIHIDVTQPEPQSPVIRIGTTINGPKHVGTPFTGRFKLLLWQAGSAKRVSYALRGDEGVSCVNVEEGTKTFAYTSRDFAGLANAHAGAGGPAGARVTADVRRAVQATDTLVGIYDFPSFATDVMSVDTPTGNRSCPCFFFSFVPDGFGTPFGPGEYTFRDTGAGGGGLGEIVLGGADARLADPPTDPNDPGCSA